MSSVRWSELNDDTSQNDSETSHCQKQLLCDQKTDINNYQPLKKTESSPPQISAKMGKFQKLNEQLQKLEEHKDPKVWLYVLDSSKNDKSTVNEILNGHEDIEKVYEMKVGWNILIKTEKGVEMIKNGIKSRGVWMRMIFSKKNKERQNKPIKKFQNKPKRQYLSPNSKTNPKPSPKKKQYNKKSSNQKSSEIQKKKIKYVARDQKCEENDKVQTITQNTNCLDCEVTAYEQKSETISTPEPNQTSNINQDIQHDSPKNEIFEHLNSEIKDIIREDENIDKSIETETIEKQQQAFSDSSEQLKQQRKKLEKKKSKKKKKSKGTGQYKDSSNPFAVLCK